jgi:formylglycine-generating enzyme required for sulfatase activity
VGESSANPFGLYDVHGNVYEWVQDSWDPNFYQQFAVKPAVDPVLLSFTNSLRVFRGGSWYNPASYARSTHRAAYDPVNRYGVIGFRVALPVDAVRDSLAR